MKIYKVNLDPSNPVEKLVKVPVGSDYGLQIIWDNERFSTFTNSNVATQNGYLVSENSTATEMTDSTTVNGQKTFLGEDNSSLPKVNNIGDTIVWVYNPTNTTDKTTSTFGSIKVLGVDADDFEIDLGSSGGSSYTSITENDYITTITNDCIEIDARAIKLTGSEVINLAASHLVINDQEYQPVSYVSITEDPCNTTISNNCVTLCGSNVSIVGNLFISDTQICMTKFLADYGV